ncbi:MAG: alpha/beta fold hydrolase [Propionibacteriaceae bacterium]|nr:alpha/beta fold hydrolase [Propionibacteriaceae bacterium]
MGSPPYRFLFLHGLFGRGRNWTGIARQLQPFSSLMVDLPNHGDSPWTTHFSYSDMAESLAGLLSTLDKPVCLVGHSMGGRLAMLTALTHPEKVERLVVEDTQPISILDNDLQIYADAMTQLPRALLGSRKEAREILYRSIRDERILDFLLQSLRLDSQGEWKWIFNLEVLRRDLAHVGTWPEISGVYDRPVMWITGSESTHVTPDPSSMKALFPLTRHIRVKGASHWVHADEPEIFAGALRQFVT